MTASFISRTPLRAAAALVLLAALIACARSKDSKEADEASVKSPAAAESKTSAMGDSSEKDSAEQKSETEAAAPEEDEAPQPVVGAQTSVVATRPFVETLGAIGTVSARAGHVASLGAPASARVTAVLVTAGDHVRVGQPLVVLDSTIVAATARSAVAAVVVAERANERAQRLVHEGISPRRDEEQAAADLARARADLLAAKRAEELSTLRSPIAGIVTRMSATLGATADPAQALVEVADPSALDVLFALTPADARRAKSGASVTLSAGQHGSGEALGSGVLYDVGGAVDSASRSVVARVRVGPGVKTLRIGETVYGEITVASHPRTLVVPTQSLVPEGDGFKLFVVDDEGVAHARAVTIGARADSVVEIVKGVQAGNRIVTIGAFGVTDGAKISTPQSSPAKQAPKQ